jgi:uncharacterized protein YpmB
VLLRMGIVVIGLLAVAFALLYDLTSSVVGSQRAIEEQARKWAAERTSITQIEEIDEYRGKQAYAVVMGKNRVGTPVIAWMNEKEIHFDTMEHAVTKQSVLDAVKRGYPGGKILHVVPGLEENRRFWEAAVRDQEGRYLYIQYDFYTGKVIKTYMVQGNK